jgi:hypothetical protein
MPEIGFVDWDGAQAVPDPATKRLDRASPTTLYLGEAHPGALSSAKGWRIRRITFNGSGDVTAVEFANAARFVSAWDDRATLEYS